MPLKFHCICGQAMIVSRQFVGRGVRCPRCETKVKVPAPRAESAPATLVQPPPLPASVQLAASPDASAEEVSQAAASDQRVHGWEPHPRDVTKAYWLAVGLALLGLFGVIPAVLDIVAHFQAPKSPGVAVWAIGVLLLALLEVAYAMYLVQVPDWSSTWVVSIVTMVIAVLYAATMGVTFVSRDDGRLVRALDLTDKLANGQATGWCFALVCLTGLFSYLSGRVSVRWFQAET